MRRRTRVLPVVAGLLVASALIRLGGAAGEVAAEALAEAGPVEDGPAAETTGGVLAALEAREARVAAREAELEERLTALVSARDELAAQVSSLEEAQAALTSTLAIADGAAAEDLDRLAAVYGAMKPKDAAALFGSMDPAFAAGFLGLMPAESAAAIMTNLEPDAAYAISAVLAGRNATVPRE